MKTKIINLLNYMYKVSSKIILYISFFLTVLSWALYFFRIEIKINTQTSSIAICLIISLLTLVQALLHFYNNTEDVNKK